MINIKQLEYTRSKAIEYHKLYNDEITAKRFETMTLEELINECVLEAASTYYHMIKKHHEIWQNSEKEK